MERRGVRSFVKALALVVVLPVACAALAYSSRTALANRWQAGLRRPYLMRRQMPDERVIARYSLARLCGDPRTAAGVPACRAYNRFSSMSAAAAVTGGVGIGFLVAIAAAGAFSRRRRDLLALVYRPAFHGTVAGLVVLVLLNGGLAVVGLSLLVPVIEGWPASLSLVLAGASLGVAISMIRHVLGATRTDTQPTVARELNAETQQGVVEWVRVISTAVGAPPAEHVLAGLRPGIFATSEPVVCLDRRVTGRTLYLSLPLARILSVEELRGLVAHELAHHAAVQAKVTGRVVLIHAGLRRSLRTLSEHGSGVRGATAWPARSVLSLFTEAFAPAVAPCFTARELAADRAAADLVGPRTLAAALVKVHAFTPAWNVVSVAMDHAVVDGTQYVNASVLFEQVVAASADPERLVGAGALSSLHPTDIHPTLAERLRALGVTPADVSIAARDTRPQPSAAGLIEGCDVIERDLSEVEHRIAALEWGRGADDHQATGWSPPRVHSAART
jgi:Zn-dependent protease with chaperone function